MAYLLNTEYDRLVELALKSLNYEGSDRKPQFGDRVVTTSVYDDNEVVEGEFFEIQMSFRKDWWDVLIWVEDDNYDDHLCDTGCMQLVEKGDEDG